MATGKVRQLRLSSLRLEERTSTALWVSHAPKGRSVCRETLVLPPDGVAHGEHGVDSPADRLRC